MVSVADTKRSERPNVLTDKKLKDISNKILNSSIKSLTKLRQDIGIIYGSAQKVYPYKVTVVQQLKPTDYEKIKWYQQFTQEKEIKLLDETFFINEAWFHLSGYINMQSTRLWLTDKLHIIHKTP